MNNLKNENKNENEKYDDYFFSYDYRNRAKREKKLLLEEKSMHRCKSKRKNMLYTLSVIPMIILTYLQLFFNLAVVTLLFYGSIQITKVFYKDVHKHMEKQSYVLMSTIVQCSKDYIRNGCSNDNVPPVLENMCSEWTLCMNQDINGILASKETAVVLAQIVNNFFGNLNDRTLYCSAALLIGSILLINGLLISMRKPVKHK